MLWKFGEEGVESLRCETGWPPLSSSASSPSLPGSAVVAGDPGLPCPGGDSEDPLELEVDL